jgi:hypothetical protein
VLAAKASHRLRHAFAGRVRALFRNFHGFTLPKLTPLSAEVAVEPTEPAQSREPYNYSWCLPFFLVSVITSRRTF